VQNLTADDVPIPLAGATGKLADWLKAFDVPARGFSYTLQQIDSRDGYDEYRVVFASSFKSTVANDNTVPAELFLPAHTNRTTGGAKIPAVVVLDILAGNGVVARSCGIGMATHGLAAIYFPMAYYGARRPPGDPHAAVRQDDPRLSADALRQTVMDVRRAKAILAAEPEVDRQRLGITGVSLGGIVTSLAAGVDGTFYRVVPILAGGDVAELTFTTRETRRVRALMEARGIDEAQLAEALAPVEPINFASRIDAGRCLMINASNDEVIPRSLTERLRVAIGGPKLLWLPSGHYSAILYLPTIINTAATFLRGQAVDRLQYGYFTSPAPSSR
jgi:dienelactone hydrolase